MTPEELAAIEARATSSRAADEWDRCVHGAMTHECSACRGDDARALLADNARLRGLVKAAEKSATSEVGTETEGNCPWCGYHVGDFRRKHAPECPAFTESGVVR